MKNKLAIISFSSVILIRIPNGVFSPTQDTLVSSTRLKKLSLEELINIKVVTASGFQINPEPAKEVDLIISSRLFRLAEVVH